MSAKTALYSYLTGIAAVTSLVGQRIYPDQAPQNTVLPYITYHQISAQHIHHLGGASGLVRRRMQVDVYGATSVSVETVVEALRDKLDGYEGTMGSGSLVVRLAAFEDERDSYAAPEDASAEPVFRTSIDVFVWHQETLPSV